MCEPPVIDMGPVRSPVRSRNSPPNVSQSKSIQPSNGSQPKGSTPKGVANKNPYNNSMLPV